MQHKVIDAKDVVIRFAGDSGDGMQLTGTLFANLSAIYGNGLSKRLLAFADEPAFGFSLRLTFFIIAFS